MKRQTSDIVRYILEKISDHPQNIVTVTAEKFSISRPAVLRHIKNLARRGLIVVHGKTRDRHYTLQPLAEHSLHLQITPHLKEDEIWRQHIRPLLNNVPSNVMDICQYGLTEMINNVVDHSEGTEVLLRISYTLNRITMSVLDDGVGIFAKIQSVFGLDDPRHAILELAKGKLTTDPERHTGEGIFFTSRSFDAFYISSDALSFTHTNDGKDWLLEEDASEDIKGTFVEMHIDPRSSRKLSEVFDTFTSQDDAYSFTKTIVPVRLAKYGDENLVSRSQAKRLLTRFERFQEVILDFKDVDTIGQAFADEVFRVFRKQNPHIQLRWVQTNAHVEKVIIRAMTNPA